ncbi:FAD-dependent oxidoreductase [Maritalea sp.]|uniref:FAD-dependent oxidoreductase n=1 Tax=Maritalea sp. TaxID=2003361 RepID=UPI0039E54C81
MPKVTPTIAVVGAGIVGVTTALALVENGFNIVLVDRNCDVAQATSKMNGAQLSYAYVDAMAAPGLISMAGRILAGQERGVRFCLKPNYHNLSWLLSFLREGSQSRFLANTKSSLKMSRISKMQMETWRTRYGFQFDHQINGKLQIFPDQKTINGMAQLMALKKEMGVRQSILTPKEAMAVEPLLANFGGDMVGALYSPDEEVGDPQLFAEGALMQILAASPRNRFLHSHTVTSIETKDGAVKSLRTEQGEIVADGYVFAMGHWAPKLAKQLGVALPIASVAGYSLTYPLGPNAPQISITDAKAKAVICPLGGRLRIAGFADFGETNERASDTRIDQLRTILIERFPGAALIEGEGEPWIGHRPVAPNSQPIVGATKLSNAFVNCGHGTLGWTLAAGTAVTLAEKICAKFSVEPRKFTAISS